MKKILFIHNNYQITGGEDVAVKNEIEFLYNNYEVDVMYFENTIKNYFLQLIYFLINNNLSSTKKIMDRVDGFQPDIVYFHNTWFKISSTIFKKLNKRKIKVLLKVHNYRWHCAKYFRHKKHLNNQLSCFACGKKYEGKKFINKYFEDSYLKSFLLYRNNKKYLKYIEKCDITLIALNQFQKNFLQSNGFSDKKIYIQFNFLKPNELIKIKVEERFVFYAGRVSEEKGINFLLEVFSKLKNIDYKLFVAGDGPMLEKLSKKYQSNPNIHFLGQLPNDKVLAYMRNALAVINPTHLIEGQPTVLTEASMIGKVSIFPDNNSIKEFFPNNYQFTYLDRNEESLQNLLNQLNDNNLLKKIGSDNKIFIQNLLKPENLLQNFKDIASS
jgi:glycosyltransferase involved in cell wall biosynthesis